MHSLQATSIFVSTISITAIALDRYKVIVYPTHQETTSGTRGALLLLAFIWVGALLLSLPLFSFRTVESQRLCKCLWLAWTVRLAASVASLASVQVHHPLKTAKSDNLQRRD